MSGTSLTRSRDFVHVQSRGARARSNGVAAAALRREDPTAPSRVGLAVGRGLGSAVARNRVKRRLRAAWREGAIPAGYDVVLRPSQAVAHIDFQDLVNHVESAVTRAIASGGDA